MIASVRPAKIAGDPNDPNDPAAFAALPAAQRRALRAWIRATLEPVRRIGFGTYAHSYGLKHEAERALGEYVSNGELKGAMLAEGYRYVRCGGRANPNWMFNSHRRPA